MKRSNFFNIMMALATVGALVPHLITPVRAEVEDDIKDNLQPIADIYDDSGDVNAGSLAETIAKVIKIILGFLGIIFLALIIYAGLLWMTSAGNDDKIETAKKIMSAAVIGSIIVFAAYIITFFVFDTLIKSTGINSNGLE